MVSTSVSTDVVLQLEPSQREVFRSKAESNITSCKLSATGSAFSLSHALPEALEGTLAFTDQALPSQYRYVTEVAAGLQGVSEAATNPFPPLISYSTATTSVTFELVLALSV